MKPDRSDGRIVFSSTQFRRYGASSLSMLASEEQRGCPRQYRALYVDDRKPVERRSTALEYGSVMHNALHIMERDSIGPEEALTASWSPELPEAMFREAVEDLNRYLDKGGPMTRFGTLDTEIDLEALLYEDEEFGPVYYRGIIDWLGLDMDSGHFLHVVDYKTNRQAPKREDLFGDVQLKGYTWLVRENWARWMTTAQPRIITHLDAIKYRDVETMYGEIELDEWQAWAEAVARKILRDDDGDPYLNPGCSWCPVKFDCPVILDLPKIGATIAERETGQTIEQMDAWRTEANSAIKALKARVDEVTERINESVVETIAEAGAESVNVGGYKYEITTPRATDIDLERLHELMGDDFYLVAGTSRAAIERYAKSRDAQTRSALLQCLEYVPGEAKVTRSKLKEG